MIFLSLKITSSFSAASSSKSLKMDGRQQDSTVFSSDDDYSVQDVFKYMAEVDFDKTLSESDVEALPGPVRKVYLRRLRERQLLRNMKKQHDADYNHFSAMVAEIVKKHERGEKLENWELTFGGKAIKTLNPKPEATQNPVTIPVTEILDDVVKGKYTLQEVHTAREGVKEAEAKDPVENSPLQLLDNVMEEALDRTKLALNVKEPGQFYDAYVSTENGVLSKEQIDNALDNASTAIQLVLGNPISSNDAKQACDAFIIASSMNEAEIKMKKCQEIAISKQEQRENLAQVAAVSGAFSAVGQSAQLQALTTTTPAVSVTVAQTLNDQTINEQASAQASTTQASQLLDDSIDRTLGFNITDLSYDISFMPPEDPNIYKPLEIISYIGMTNNVL